MSEASSELTAQELIDQACDKWMADIHAKMEAIFNLSHVVESEHLEITDEI